MCLRKQLSRQAGQAEGSLPEGTRSCTESYMPNVLRVEVPRDLVAGPGRAGTTL